MACHRKSLKRCCLEFAFIISHDCDFRPTDALLSAISAWIETNTRAGVRLDGRPLAPADSACTVRVRSGRVIKMAGPATASPEQVCAYELYRCRSIDEALELATRHPMAAVATIEVRRVWSERLQR